MRVETLCLAAAAFLAAQPVAAQQPTEANLRVADAEQMRIIVEEDAKAQHEFMHPNYLLNGPANVVKRKAEVVSMLAHGQIASERFTRKVEGVAITGNVGIVMGSEVVTPAANSNLGRLHPGRTLDRRYTNVFVWENGSWKFVARQASIVSPSAPAEAGKPLVLQPSDGEARMRRPPPSSLSTLAAPFLIKVDERNGGARDFVIFTEDVPVGQTISPHRHPHSEEILFIHAGTGTAWLDGKEAKVGPGSIIFMPPNTGVRLTNDGTQPISLMAVFSRPGFDKYQRDISVPAGAPAEPLTVEELTTIRARHTQSVHYDPPPSKPR